MIGFILLSSFITANASAQEGAKQPYIDQLKQGLPPKEESSGSYTEELRRKNAQGKKPPENPDGYTESLRNTLPPAEPQPPSYSDSVKSGLAPKKEGGAIQAVKDGKSELEARKSGEIHHAAGFRLGTGASRTVTGSSGVTSGDFYTYYERGWVPDLNFFYEYQPFHSEVFGNFGLVAGVGLTYQKGAGIFRVALLNPFTGQTFGSTSRTTLRFITVPMSLGVNYRFNLLRYVRPYVQAAPTLIGYMETRSDAQSDRKGKSTGYQFSGGANILLDGIFKKGSWELYDVYGVKHYYLTVDYTKLATVAGEVEFDASTLSLGLTYEF